ncbi:meiotic recombination protein REC114-like [Corticium candelabrum]|uniref:meiotic recombination protein REC114-like n=1 Tax=Corticium candelabrum TaxID=121492 RepID=UPI002E25FE8D|nr:meiotic recombination protein REC114-like [Corticium candelabrum]
MEPTSHSWKIAKYARFQPDKSLPSSFRKGGPPPGNWKQYDDKEIHLLLVSEQQLIVKSGTDFLENLSLWNARSWLNCMTKGDTLAFVWKKEGLPRKFKLQFSAANGQSGETLCRNCAKILQRHVAVQYPDENRSDVGQSDNSQQQSQTLQGSQVQQMSCQMQEPQTSTSSQDTISVSTVAEAMLTNKPLPMSMSTAYARTNYSKEQLTSFISLCLSDPNFPMFVEAVKNELEQLAASDTTDKCT